MQNNGDSRRCFLKVLAHASLTLGSVAALGCGDEQGGVGAQSSSTGGAVGNVKTLPVGSLQAVPADSLAIGRDAAGVYALTLICTHQGCDMSQAGSVSSAGIYCACHGSQFDVNGNVLQGPAGSPLEHFTVSIGATGDITVDTTKPVAESTRVAVPSGLA